MRKIFVATICLVFFFAESAFASTVEAQIILGHITGTVTDAATGLPISGATVTASIGSKVNGTATTNATGYYNIGGLSGNFAGIVYNVTAQDAGYYSFTVPVTMVSSIDFVISQTQNFTLTSMTTPEPTPMPTPSPPSTTTPTPTIPEFPTSTILLTTLFASAILLIVFRFAKNRRPPA
jgi:hypothetical protein